MKTKALLQSAIEYHDKKIAHKKTVEKRLENAIKTFLANNSIKGFSLIIMPDLVTETGEETNGHLVLVCEVSKAIHPVASISWENGLGKYSERVKNEENGFYETVTHNFKGVDSFSNILRNSLMKDEELLGFIRK